MKHGALSVLAVAVLLAAVLNACSLTANHKEALEYHTRFFENRMGLHPLTSVVFVEKEDMEGFCGHVGWRAAITEKGLGYEGPVIWYSLNLGCNPRETALHETCHLRWMHHRMSLSKDVEESEVRDCMRAYRRED